MSSWRQAFMTEYKPTVKEIKVSGLEKHHNADCKYVRREAMQNDKKIYYWIRHCSCGNEADRSNKLNVNAESIVKEEGVEMHLKDECVWILPKPSKFHWHTCVCKRLILEDSPKMNISQDNDSSYIE